MATSKAKTNVDQLNDFASWNAYSHQSTFEKLKETISVKDFGAVGDGVADDTAAIQSAVDAAGQRMIRRVLMDGTAYRITAPIIVSYSNVSIEITGKLIYDGSSASFVDSTNLKGAFSILGVLTGSPLVYSLSANMVEGSDTIQLPSVSAFSVGDFWKVRPSSSEWGPMSFMLEVTAVNIGASTVSFLYKSGWAISSGTSYTFQKIIPVRNVSVLLNEFQYNTTETGDNGVAGIAEQYTLDCNSVIGTATNTKYPGVLKRWCIGGVSSVKNLQVPQDITTGGMGYGIQQIHCIYSHAENTRTTKGRHVVDWSGCAYCVADGMYGSQSLANTTEFSCHLAYDHDNTLMNFMGWLSWDNLPTFGQSGKRLRAENGIAVGQLAWFNTTPDCSFTNVQVIGDIIVNADGATLTNVTQTSGTTRIWQSSTMSTRGTTEFISCDLTPATSTDFVNSTVTSPIRFIGGSVGPTNGVTLRGSTITSSGTAWSASSTAGATAVVYTPLLQLNGTFDYTPWRVLGTNCNLQFSGTLMNYNDTLNGFVDSRITSGTTKIKLSGDYNFATNTALWINWTGGGGNLQLSVAGATVSLGKIISAGGSGIGANGYMNFSGDTLVGTSVSRPVAGARVSFTGEQIL